MQKSGTSKHCLYTITSKMMSQHSIGQVLCSLCHLYLFSFSKPLPRFCHFTYGATAHLLRIIFSDCSSKSVFHTGSTAWLSPSHTRCKRFPLLILFSQTLLRYSILVLIPSCRIQSVFCFALILPREKCLHIKWIQLFFL